MVERDVEIGALELVSGVSIPHVVQRVTRLTVDEQIHLGVSFGCWRRRVHVWARKACRLVR